MLEKSYRESDAPLTLLSNQRGQSSDLTMLSLAVQINLSKSEMQVQEPIHGEGVRSTDEGPPLLVACCRAEQPALPTLKELQSARVVESMTFGMCLLDHIASCTCRRRSICGCDFCLSCLRFSALGSCSDAISEVRSHSSP